MAFIEKFSPYGRMFTLCAILSLSTGVFRSAGAADVFSNVPEAAGYTLVYQLDIPNSCTFTASVPYSVNNSASIVDGSFKRVGYYLQVQAGAGALQWVYVSFDAAPFQTAASKIGVPNVTSGIFYKYDAAALAAGTLNAGQVKNMNVLSNVPGIVTGTGIATGNVEFWPSNYTEVNQYGVPNANAATFDFGDGGAGTGQGHGSMQIHNYGASQTLFSFSHFHAGPGHLGIGNQPTASPDWTFNDNVASYSIKTLQIVVDQAPKITSLSPIADFPAGGATVTVNGTGFKPGATSITFGGTLGTSLTYVSSTKYTVVAPAHAAGTVDVVMTAADAQVATLTNGFQYSSTPAPSIISIAPIYDVTAGGKTVTITGTNFRSGATVTFGGSNGFTATQVTPTTVSANTIVVVVPASVPANTKGLTNVVVTNTDATSATLTNGFTYATATQRVANVPESANYSVVYQLDIPNTNQFTTGVPYSINNTASIPTGSFSRIGYYLELDNGSGLRWVYVSFDALPFQTNPAKIGVPNVTSGELYKYDAAALAANTPNAGQVKNMNVFSNVAGIVTGTGITTGNVEFWPSDYNATNQYAVPNANASTYDFGDGNASAAQGHGSMQIHNFGAQQTLFSFSHFHAGPGHLGIGNQATGNPDWTFNDNVATYTVKTLQVVINDNPFITSVSPANGAVSGGTPVSIIGSGFKPGVQSITFDGIPGTNPVFVNDTTYTVVTPAHALGPVTVVMTDSTSKVATLPNGFTYAASPPPVVTSVTLNPTGAATGPAGGGTNIIINGTDFRNTTPPTVQIGGTNGFTVVNATNVVFVSATQINCTTPASVPAGAIGATRVQVTNTDNSTSGFLNNAFTYTSPAPTVASVSPNTGAYNINTNVIITGTGFASNFIAGGGTVTFGGQAASNVAFVSSTQLNATVQAKLVAQPFVVNCVVTNPGGLSGTLNNAFTYFTTSQLLANVPEAANYTVVYHLDIGNGNNFSTSVPYLINNAANVATGSFSRVGYYLELKTGAGPLQWVYASFDADVFNNNASKLGVPNVASGEFYHYDAAAIANNTLNAGQVKNMTVLSNVPGIVTGTGITTGNVEFWPSNYNNIGNAYNVPNANASVYDFGDTGAGTGQGHGSMQIHNYGASQTLFAFNDWNAGAGALGIGNRPTADTDWTFANNVGTYSIKTLQVVVGNPNITRWIGTVAGGSDALWSTASNWDRPVPDISKVSVILGSTSGSPASISLQGTNRTVGTLSFANSTNTTLAGTGGMLILDNGTDPPGINVTGGTHAISTDVSLNANAVLNITSGSLGIAGNIIGPGRSVTKSGIGLLALSNANSSFDGGIKLSAGILQAAAPGNLGSGKVTFEGGTLQYASGATADLSGKINPVATGQQAIIDTNGNNVAFNSVISGAGGLTKAGAGTLTLAVSNTYTGATTVNLGNLIVNSGPLGALNVNGGIADIAPAVAVNGATTLNGGLLQAKAASTLQNSQVIVNANNTLAFAPAIGTFSVAGLSGAGAVPLQDTGSAAVTLQIGAAGGNSSFSGKLSGPGGISKLGTGTFNIGGVNTYSGPTIIGGGTLRMVSGAKIMPLGDSITDGTGGTNAGYRFQLLGLLNGSGATTQYVGSATTMPGALPTSPVDQTHHEGHGGFTVAQILNGVTPTAQGGLGWLNVNPDIITLMIGTNDSGGSALNAVTTLGNVIDMINSQKPNTRLIVAQITPYTGRETFVNDYNSRIATLVNSKIAAGYNLQLVDLNTGFPANSLPDGLHPNDTGYAFMAQQWFNAILSSGLNGTLPAATAVTLASNSKFDLNGSLQQIGSLADAAPGPITGHQVLLGAGKLTVGNATSTTFSGVISGAGGSLVKTGTGALILTNTSTYDSTTTVSAGDLRGTGTLSASTVLIPAPAGAIWPGITAGTGIVPAAGETLTVAGLNLTGGGRVKIALNTSSANSTQRLAVTGSTCNLTGGELSLGIPAGSVSANTYTVLISNSSIVGAFSTFKLNGVPFTNGSGPVLVTVGSNAVTVKITGAVTPVKIAGFTAKAEGAGVLLDWTAVSEYQNGGFNIYRRAVDVKEWSRLNPALLPGRITNADAKHYSYYDWAAAGMYEYKLESVSISGAREADYPAGNPVSLDWNRSLTEVSALSSDSIASADAGFEIVSAVKKAESAAAIFETLNVHASKPSAIGTASAPKAVSVRAVSAIESPVSARSQSPTIANPAASGLVGARWFTSVSVGRASNAAAKVTYSNPGVMLIPQSDMPAGYDLKHVTLQRGGRNLPALTQMTAGLLVYVPGYKDDYTNKDVLFLRKSAAATSAGQVQSAAGLFSSATPVNVTSPTSVTNEYHDVYFDYLLRPYNFAPWFSSKYLTQGTAQEFTLNLPQVSGGTATLVVNLWSLTSGDSINPNHALQVLVNGQALGQTTWDAGNKMMQLPFDIPSGVLKTGDNVVSLITPANAGQDSQISLLHSITANYTRLLDGSKTFEIVNSGSTARMYELFNVPAAGAWVVDARYTDRAALVPAETLTQPDGTLRLRFMASGGGSGKYIVTPVGQEFRPLSVAARQIKALRLNGPYLATGPAQFSSSVQPLLTRRGKEGLRGAFIDQEQLFDYYNYGRYGPDGIRNAVRSVRPQYLLLAGRTTTDYHDYSGSGVDPLCPTYLVSTSFWSQTTSDAMFGDLGRGYPEVKVGRIPANSPGECAVAVRRILSNAGLPVSGWRGQFTADVSDPAAGDFAAEADTVIAANPDMAFARNYLGVTFQSAAEVSTAMTQAANGEADLLFYTGHGSAARLGATNPPIMDANQVQAWNGNVVFIAATCTFNWVAKNEQNYHSIPIQAMVQPQGGIAASISTTTYMNSAPAMEFTNQLLTQTRNMGSGARWGDALLRAQQWAYSKANYGAEGNWYMDLSRTECLLGDPAMPVYGKRPGPAGGGATPGTAPATGNAPGQF